MGCTSRRRSLTEIATEESSKVLNGDEADYHSTLEACGDFDYEGHLYINADPHFFAIASPMDEAVAAGCPFVVANVAVSKEDGIMNKQMLVWENKEDAESHFDQESLLMGTFKLSELARAYQETDASSGDVYDVLTNNCAGFVRALAPKLGVKIDSKVTSFVARRLFEDNGKELVDYLKSSANYLSHFMGRNLRAVSATDEEFIDLLVEESVTGLHSQ